MINIDLKKVIEKYFGEIDKMSSDRSTEVFLELHKELVLIMAKEFEISDPIIGIANLNLINKDKNDNKTAGMAEQVNNLPKT